MRKPHAIRYPLDVFTRLVGPAIVVAILAPIVMALIYALAYGLGGVGSISDGWTLEPFQRLIEEGSLPGSLLASLLVAAATVLVTVTTGIWIAIGALHQRAPLQTTAYYLPLLLPPAVAAFVIALLLGNAGLLARLAVAVGLIDSPAAFPTLTNDPLHIGIIATHWLMGFGFFALFFRSILAQERLPLLHQLAQTLGATPTQAIGKVVVPILLYRARTNIVLFFLYVFGSFEIPLLLGRSSPKMLAVLAYEKFTRFDLGEKPEAYLIAVIYSLFVFGTLALLHARRRL